MPTTLIIGAGAAGLAAARTLHAAGADFVLVDAAPVPGGRLRTDYHPDGFLLDHGFQIFLTSYPEAKRWLGDYAGLGLRSFESGARIHAPAESSGRLTVRNPLKAGVAGLSALVAPIGTLTDKWRLARLALDVARHDDVPTVTGATQSTLDYLRAYGFSEQIIDTFFRPFFGGVFLDRHLATTASMLRFTLRQFLTTDAALPAGGIGAVGAALAAPLPPTSVRLSTPVVDLEGTSAVLASGERRVAAAVIVATDAATAARLLGEVAPAPAAWRTTTVAYYAAPTSPQHADCFLTLEPRPDALVHNCCVPSDVQPTYAPAGQALVSVSSHGPTALGLDDDPLDARLRAELRVIYRDAPVDTWRRLGVYRLRHALPAFPPGGPPAAETAARPVRPGVWVAGDHRAYPSLNGALAAGRLAAEAVLAR